MCITEKEISRGKRSGSLVYTSTTTKYIINESRKKLLPLQKKTVEIINFALNKEVINLHCSSSEDDLGLKLKTYPLFFRGIVSCLK